MEAKFFIESGQAKVLINGEWNALSLFLESDLSFPDAISHIQMKKKNQWMGNSSVLQIISGSKFEVSTSLDIELKTVEIFQKQLLTLIDAWVKFKKDKVQNVVNV